MTGFHSFKQVQQTAVSHNINLRLPSPACPILSKKDLTPPHRQRAKPSSFRNTHAPADAITRPQRHKPQPRPSQSVTQSATASSQCRNRGAPYATPAKATQQWPRRHSQSLAPQLRPLHDPQQGHVGTSGTGAPPTLPGQSHTSAGCRSYLCSGNSSGTSANIRKWDGSTWNVPGSRPPYSPSRLSCTVSGDVTVTRFDWTWMMSGSRI